MQQLPLFIYRSMTPGVEDLERGVTRLETKKGKVLYLGLVFAK